MSKLIERIRETEDFASFKGTSYDQINAAETKLKLKFADEYRDYLIAFGAAECKGKELTGICNSERLSVVYTTERARKYYPGFPADAYVIEELLFDHVVAIQKTDGSVYYYGPNDNGKRIASSIEEYLFPGN